MADALDEALRLIAEHRRRSWKLAPQRELEEELLQEERRKAAWMDVPKWRTFWDESTKDFKVPEGWPEGKEPEPQYVPERQVEQESNTVLHKMLRNRTGICPR